MRAIRPGDRGPAVEDIQRRLLALGYDLGRSGVDGVFLGETLAAVKHFQSEHSLTEDGIVGDETWPALVDSTFTLGDRLLYLRLPYFHGRDVAALQGALNALGFACGSPDGIFGPFTERAVREFQRNTGQPSDGIVGSETVSSLVNLRYVWDDKDPKAPIALKVAPARACEALTAYSLGLSYSSDESRDVAERIGNLAKAAHASASVDSWPEAEGGSDADVVLHLGFPPAIVARGEEVPVVAVSGADDPSTAARILTALNSLQGKRGGVAVDLSAADTSTERARQRIAVRLLDGVCAALARPGSDML